MTIFLLDLKRIFKQPINWAFILLFPFIFTILINFSTQSGNTEVSMPMYFGVVDLDRTPLSKTLVKQLGMRYTVVELAEADINAALTDSEVPWALLIREGYGEDVLAGRAPALEGYSLTISDVSALGGVTAENITRALMLLGSGDPAVLETWEGAASVEVTLAETGDAWGLISAWFNFFGFLSIFTAYFITKTLLDDKRGGMPDRLGVLPVAPMRFLVTGTLAAFAATEITAVLLLLVVRLQLGVVPNPLHLFGLLSLYSVFSVAFVLAILSATRNTGVASVVMTMFATFFSMLGGLFWPIEFVPEFMRKLAWFSPGYWLGQGLANIRTVTFSGYTMPMLFLAGFTLVALLLGGWKKIQPMEE